MTTNFVKLKSGTIINLTVVASMQVHAYVEDHENRVTLQSGYEFTLDDEEYEELKQILFPTPAEKEMD